MLKQILLADDSAATRTSVENALGPDDYRLVTAEDGRAAMDRINDGLPHLVLAHALLPEIDGYEICRQIKENPDTSHIPVLLLTGTFEPFDINRAKNVHYDGFITKPLDPRELKSVVRRCIESAVYPAVEPDPVEPEFDAAEVSDFPGSSAAAVADDGSDAMLDRIFPDDQPLEVITSDDQESDDLFSIDDPVTDPDEEIPAAEPVFEASALEPPDTAVAADEPVDRRSPDFGIWGTGGTTGQDEAEITVETTTSEDPATSSEDSDLSWFLRKYEDKSRDAEEASSGPFMTQALDDDSDTEKFPEPVDEPLQSDPLLESVEPLAAPTGEEIAPPPSTAPLVLDEQQLEQISRRVVRLLSDTVVRDVAWEAVPEIAERLIRERLREIEAEADTPS
jgi:CheY-like chemotaxis protein